MKTQTQLNFPFPEIPKIPNHYEQTMLKSRAKDAANEYHRLQLEKAQDEGVGIVHIYDPELPKGGLTIAFKKCSEFKSGTMVDVAINVCSSKDSFSKKIGTFGALDKFFAAETVSLPLLRMYSITDINWVVKQAFTALYKAM